MGTVPITGEDLTAEQQRGYRDTLPFKHKQLFKAAFRRVGISKEELRIEMNLDLSGHPRPADGGIVDTVQTRFYMTRYGKMGIGVE